MNRKIIQNRPTRFWMIGVDDVGFDAAFGGLGVEGRDAAHWKLLADAVAADVAAEEEGGARPDLALPPLGIEPPARLKPPRFSPPRPWTRMAAVTATLALAALALFALRTPPPGDPALMGPRGASDPANDLPAPLDLAVAVKTSTGTARFDANRAYAVGDSLVFQITLPAPATVELSRAVGASSTLLWSGSLPAGQQTLPAAYALDAADAGRTTFTVRAVTATGALERSMAVQLGAGALQ